MEQIVGECVGPPVPLTPTLSPSDGEREKRFMVPLHV